MSKTKKIIGALIVVAILLVVGVIILYQQTPGAVELPTISWPDNDDEYEQLSCGGVEVCPEGYTCIYPQGGELGTCAKNIEQVPAKITCGGIAGLECPEGYSCDWKVKEGTPDRWGECKQNK